MLSKLKNVMFRHRIRLMRHLLRAVFITPLWFAACAQGASYIEPEFFQVSADVYVNAHFGKGYNWNNSFIYSKLVPQPYLANQTPDDAVNGYKGYLAWDGTHPEIASDIIIAGLSPSAEITSIVQFKDVPAGTYELHSFVDLTSQRIHRDHDPSGWGATAGDEVCLSHSQNTLTAINGDGTTTLFATGTPSDTGGTVSSLIQFTYGGSAWSAPVAVPLASGSSTDPEVTLYDIEFIGGNTYFVVGEGGRIYTSTDSGATWTRQQNIVRNGTPTTYLRPLYSVACESTTNCLISGYNGAILVTTDGGSTWIVYDNDTTLSTKTSRKLVSIDIPAPGSNGACPLTTPMGSKCAWAVGELGNIIVIDLDAAFAPQQFLLQYAKDNANALITKDYNSVVAISNTLAWAVGEYDSDTSTALLARLNNSTQGWERQTAVAGIPLVNLYSIGYDGTNLWVAGADQTFYESSGTALTSIWNKRVGQASNPSPASGQQDMLGMLVLNSTNVYLAGIRGTVYRTTDGGGTAGYLLDRRASSYLTPTKDHADTDGTADGLDNTQMIAEAPHPDHDSGTDGFCTVHGANVSANHPIDHDRNNQNNDGFCALHGGMEAIKIANASNGTKSYLYPDPADPKYSIRNIEVNAANQILIRNMQFRLGSKTNNNFWPYDDAGWDTVLTDAEDNDDGWNEWY